MKYLLERGAKGSLLFLLSLSLAFSAWAEDSLRETPVVKAVRRASPAVVNISTEKLTESGLSLPFDDPLFEKFFRDIFPDFGPQKRVSLGSGVIIDSRGYILTNAHVILRGSTITVGLYDGRKLDAKLIGSEPDLDLAVLKVESKDPLPTIPLGRSSDLMVGEPVIAIGNPYGFTHTVTTGVISALNRSIRIGDNLCTGFIQTDTPINPGNSGGALLNIYGELIGINTAIYSQTGGYQGIGFAIPVDRAMKVTQALLKYGKFRRGYFGFSIQPLDPQIALALGLTSEQGIIVKWVDPKGPAAKSGLRQGDIIIAVDSLACGTFEDFNSLMSQHVVGEKVALDIIRANVKLKLEVSSVEVNSEIADELAWYKMGIQVNATSEGLIIEKIRARGPAEEIGLRRGDVIVAINEIPVRSEANFIEAMAKLQYAQSAILTVRRNISVYRFVFPMEY